MAKNKNPINNAQVTNKNPSYITWDKSSVDSKQQALKGYCSALETSVARYSDYPPARTDYSGLSSTTDGRPGFSARDFDWFRPGQAAPCGAKNIISFARYAYRRIGLIHNAIDLMGDFSCQGINLVHKNKKIEKFYKEWFEQVKGQFVSERMANLLFREANAVIRMYSAKLNKKNRNKMQKAVGEAELKVEKDGVFEKYEIPWKYTFLDTLLVDYATGSFSSVSKKKALVLKIPDSIQRDVKALQEKVKQADGAVYQEILDNLSPDILNASNAGKPILLPPDKTYLLHYKKDDWQPWADPILYSAFEPLNLYQRLQLADKAALDGAISKVRIWKVGNIEAELFPDSNTTALLADILGANVGGGTFDIVWGPDIELLETNSDVQSFLGEEKYKPTLMAIYATLGIPPTLTGTFGANGTTNNYISLKTLTERLNYVRSIIIDFWKEQIKIVQKSMGFKTPAEIEFDFMSLDDPTSMAQLLLNLADRNIVSNEFVRKNVKANPEIEDYRILEESQFRYKNDMEKISPYHKADKEHELSKIALQLGIVAPSEVGLELEPKGKDKGLLEIQQNQLGGGKSLPSGSTVAPKPVGLPGRPKNSNDKAKRKEKTFSPKTKASYVLWAKQAQDIISEIINPAILDGFGKATLRSLTNLEFDELERLKFEILCNLQIDEPLTQENVSKAATKELHSIHLEFKSWLKDAESTVGKLSVDQVRDLMAEYYAYFKLMKG